MQPLDRVAVRLNMSNTLTPGAVSGSDTVPTDSTGHFEFHNVALADYSILVQRDGYFGRALDGKPGQNAVSFGTLTPARSNVQITLSLTPAITISGRVTDSTGRLMTNVQVYSMRKLYLTGRLSLSVPQGNL